MRALLLSLLLAAGLQAADRKPQAGHPQTFVIGISPFLDRSVKDDVYRGIVRLLVEQLPLDSTVAVYDAFDLKTITHVTLPNARVFDSPKTRANQFAAAIGDVRQFLAQEHTKPVKAQLNFSEAIRFPQFCDFLCDVLPGTHTPLTVLLIGSPLYQDSKEPDFSMADGYFPSDGHLRVSREKSVFGFNDRADVNRPLVVNWVFFGDPWVSDLHKEKVTRFWTLYLERRASRLVTFCDDLSTVLESFRRGPADLPAPSSRWTLDPQQTQIAMLRVGREVETASWIERDAITETARHAPSVMVGLLKIGIRWKGNIDLDLYATPHTGAETLFFQHPRSPEGYYYKDHRSSPGREYEFIEFESPVDIRNVEAYVNFYKGSSPGGPQGEVRIEFDGRIYAGPFSIPASEGNRGRSGDSQEAFWARIPVQRILHLPLPDDRAG